MIERRAKEIQLHINKSLSEDNKDYRLGKIIGLIQESISELEREPTHREYKHTNNEIKLRLFYNHGTNKRYNKTFNDHKGGGMSAHWISHRILKINDDDLEHDINEFREFAGADYFERLERIVIDELELSGFYTGLSQPNTESKAHKKRAKIGRPPRKRDISGFDGFRFSNIAKQAAYEQWLEMKKKGAKPTAKTLWGYLYSLADTNASELTSWIITGENSLSFNGDKLSFSSLDTGSYMRDFRNASIKKLP